MKQYFTCDGCNFIYPFDQLNILDSKEVLCVPCLVERIEEDVDLDEEEEEEEEVHPRRPFP
jgi:hypothetical protein